MRSSQWTAALNGLSGATVVTPDPDSYGAFDGTDDDISFGDYGNMGTNDYTASLWFRTSGLITSLEGLFHKSRPVSEAGRWFLIIGNAGPGIVSAAVAFSGSATIINSPTRLDDDEWHHALYRLDRNGDHELWIDGEMVASGDISPNSAVDVTAGSPMRIGAYNSAADAAANWFGGDISRVGAWTRALSDSEIATLASGNMVAGANRILWTDFDDEYGVTLDNPDGTDGTLTGDGTTGENFWVPYQLPAPPAPPPTEFVTVTSAANSGAGSLRDVLESYTDVRNCNVEVTIQASLATIDLRSQIVVERAGRIYLRGNSNIVQSCNIKFSDCTDIEVSDLCVVLFCGGRSTDALVFDNCERLRVFNCELYGGCDQVLAITACPDFEVHDCIVAYAQNGFAAFIGHNPAAWGEVGSSGTIYGCLWAFLNARPTFNASKSATEGYQLSNNVFYDYTNGPVVVGQPTNYTPLTAHLDYVDNRHQGGVQRPVPSGVTNKIFSGGNETTPPSGAVTYYADGNVSFTSADVADPFDVEANDEPATRILTEQFASRPGDVDLVDDNAGCSTRTAIGTQVVNDYVARSRSVVTASLAHTFTTGGIGWDPATGAMVTGGDQEQLQFKWPSIWEYSNGNYHRWKFDIWRLQDRNGTAFLTGTVDIEVIDADTGASLYQKTGHTIATAINRGDGTGTAADYVSSPSVEQQGVIYLHTDEESPWASHSGPLFNKKLRLIMTYNGMVDTTTFGHTH